MSAIATRTKSECLEDEDTSNSTACNSCRNDQSSLNTSEYYVLESLRCLIQFHGLIYFNFKTSSFACVQKFRISKAWSQMTGACHPIISYHHPKATAGLPTHKNNEKRFGVIPTGFVWKHGHPFAMPCLSHMCQLIRQHDMHLPPAVKWKWHQNRIDPSMKYL